MPPAAETPKTSLFLIFFRAVGPAFAIGGIRLMPSFYTLGVVCVYIGLALSLAEVVREPVLLVKPSWIQIVLIAVVLAMFDWFTIGVVFAPARLDIEAYAIGVPHFAGDDLGGIKWTDKDTDLRVWIRNPTTEPYQQIDIVIDTNAYLNGAGLLQKIPSCSVGLSNEMEAHATATDSSGTKHIIGLPIESTLGLGYRILCDQLPALSSIQLVLATSINPNGAGLFTEAVQKPNLGVGTPLPTVVMAKGTYISAFRKRNLNKTIDVAVR